MKDLIERQDAINALNELYEYMRVIDPTEAADLVRQGVFLAEKKIENMPSAQPDSKETSSTHKALDTISRQAAIKAFKDFLTIHDSRGVEYLCSAVTMDGVNKILSDLPSAQPERKTGKWNFIGDNMFECTSCGVVYTTRQLNGLRNYDTDPYAPKFCPNCGADNRIKHTDASPYDSHDPMSEPYKERKNETDNSNQTD